MTGLKIEYHENVSTTLAYEHRPGETVVKTVGWGNFKIRKNGRIFMSIGEGANREIVRVSPIKSSGRY